MHTALGPRQADRALLGSILVDAHGLDPAHLAQALEHQRASGARLGDILVSSQAVSPGGLFRGLAQQHNVQFVDLRRDPPDRSLLRPDLIESYVGLRCLPWKSIEGRVVVAAADPATLPDATSAFGLPADTPFVVVEASEIVACLQKLFSSELTHSATRALAEQRPRFSAQQVVTKRQAIFLVLLAAFLIAAFATAPTISFLAINGILSVWFLTTTVFKILLVERGLTHAAAPPQPASAAPGDDELPIYTILVPMYKEPEVLPLISKSLLRLDYPWHKLDIKLVLEEDDVETIAVAESLKLPTCFEIILVPPSHPRTKPKACNYALRFARGDYLVIYDAEDQPEADQLKKVLREFDRLPPEYGCIQARLNYFNADENWVTRMFTLEYTLLFDSLLPGLFRLGMPIPLGGTSNHFKMSALRDVGAWDPYNVTEDADLGVRLSQVNYRVGVIDSTTLEEANCEVGNWIRQRSRWIKGYMQTWLVHMRDPLHLLRSVGARGFIGFQLFVGGTIINSFAALGFWAVFLAWVLGYGDTLADLFPTPLVVIGVINFLLCNAALVYTTMLPPIRRNLWSLVPWTLTIPAYWMLMSVAACKALWQLITKPFHWEKTQHGISRFVGSPGFAGTSAEPEGVASQGAR